MCALLRNTYITTTKEVYWGLKAVHYEKPPGTHKNYLGHSLQALEEQERKVYKILDDMSSQLHLVMRSHERIIHKVDQLEQSVMSLVHADDEDDFKPLEG